MLKTIVEKLSSEKRRIHNKFLSFIVALLLARRRLPFLVVYQHSFAFLLSFFRACCFNFMDTAEQQSVFLGMFILSLLVSTHTTIRTQPPRLCRRKTFNPLYALCLFFSLKKHGTNKKHMFVGVAAVFADGVDVREKF